MQESFSANGTIAEQAAVPDGYSEEMQEIMGRMPSWIIRQGVIIIGCLLLVIFTAAWFFRYPDIITSRVVISFDNPPIKLYARSSAPIQKLFVRNNQQVKQDELLCIFNNSADYSDVKRVAITANMIDTTIDIYSIINSISLPAGLQLGELQPAYIELAQAVQQYQFFISHNSYKAKMNHLLKQAEYQSLLANELDKKGIMLREQLELQRSRFNIDSILLKEKVVSKVEYEDTRSRFLDQQMNTDANYSNILQSKLQEKEYEKNISETALQLQSDENTYQRKVHDAATKFKGSYSQWSQQYLIKSPSDGTVSFFKYWKENQFVQSGDGVMMLIPNAQNYIVRGDVSSAGVGKIKPGQEVLIKLSAYPYEEYGMLSGEVAELSRVAMDSTFTLEIKLKKGLVTNANKTLPPEPQLTGNGEILTEDKSILQRLFENVFGKMRR